MPRQNKSNPAPETRTIEEVIEFGCRTFSEYVTQERLVPSLEDGLKPVYKRVLLAAHEICPRKFIKTATLSGHTLGKLHPHSVTAIDDVITELVHMGLLEGDGAFGSKSLTGNHSPASASRYTMVRLNQKYADTLDMLLRFVPLVEGEMDNREAAYLPTPVPILCSYGSFSLAPGLTVKIPAFTWQSMMDAYKSNDPDRLELAYRYTLANRECLNDIWNKGRANMTIALTLQSGSLAGSKGVFISGSPQLFFPDLSCIQEWKDEGFISVTDVSSGNDNRLFVGINKGVRSVSVQDLIDRLKPVTTYQINILMLALSGGTARPCGLKTWIKYTQKTFCGLVDRYKEDQIEKCRKKIEMFRAFDRVRDHMLKNAGKDQEPAEIAKASGTEEWIVREIDSLSVHAMRVADPAAEIKKLEDEIRKTEKIKGRTESEKLVRDMNREPY